MPAAEQLRAAFTTAASSAGPSHVVVRLDPAELGRVQIGISRQADGPARVELLAERPDTLQLLMRDQPALHRALDLAGVPVEGRVLHFQLGAADDGRDPAPAPLSQWAAQRAAQSADQSADPAANGTGLGAGAGGQSGSNGGNGQAQGRGQPQPWGGPPSSGDHNPRLPLPARAAHGSRPGVDITA